MRAARLPGALLVALGVFVSAWPLRDLFEHATWTGPLLLSLILIVAVGAALRAGGRPGWVVAAAQAGALGLALLVTGGGGTLAQVPGGSIAEGVPALLVDALTTVRDYPVPAPATPGVTFVLVLALTLLAWAADVLGVTFRRPALAALPLLAPFLTAVANGDGALPVIHFAGTAACWLALLAETDREALTAWAGRRRGDDLAATMRVRAWTAVGVAAVAVTLAVAAAAVTPHLPVRYLAGGLGEAGSGGAGGQVGFSPDTDLLRDLRSTDTDPVVEYRSDDPTPPPLRVAVSTRYADGRWRPLRVRVPVSGSPALEPPVGLAGHTPRTPRTVRVDDNRLAAPYVATPVPVVGGSLIDARWSVDPVTGVLAADRSPSGYELTYLDVEPTPAQLRGAPEGNRPPDVQEALDTGRVTETVTRTAEEVTSTAGTPYDRALALQRYFRDNDEFTYSLELAPPPAGMSPEDARRTSVDRFLESKQGYCVQYATAMILMARVVGIPARLATGFLPGTVEGDTRVVQAADAHAWPELYFDGAGWLRFEPTPSVQSGPAPAYAPDATSGDPTTAPATPGSSPTPTAATPTPTAGTDRRPELGAGTVEVTPAEASWDRRWLLLPAGLVVLLGGLSVVPLAAWRARRRRLGEQAPDADRIESLWSVLRDDLGDLGVRPSPAGTLVDQEAQLRAALLLDEEPGAALGRLIRSVESARYAPEGRAVAVLEAQADAETVRRAATRSRPWTRRLRALLWPRSGREALRRGLRPRPGRRRHAPAREREGQLR